MKRSRSFSARLVLALFALAGFGCRSTQNAALDLPERPTAHETLNAVAWMQQSAEYAASTLQAYRTAGLRLREALSDSNWNALPSVATRGASGAAIIVDVDETVLDNSPYQARLIDQDALYSRSSWNAWVEEAAARAIPGALEFARSAAEAGVRVFYVTNRSAELESATRRNLAVLGFPVSETEDAVLTRGERPEWTGDKSTRREYVAARYRVLLLVGDDLNDFVAADGSTRVERDRLVKDFGDRWGTSWIVLPNPAYGSWERVINREAGARSRTEQIEAKSASLRTR